MSLTRLFFFSFIFVVGALYASCCSPARLGHHGIDGCPGIAIPPGCPSQCGSGLDAAGVISLLTEKDTAVRSYAVQQLLTLVDQFWSEISDDLIQLELLYDEPAFPDKETVALVVSKVHYYLGSLDESLHFALGAGKLFNPSSHDHYVETIIARAIDSYVAQCEALALAATSGEKPAPIDPRLTDIVQRMFAKCLKEGEYRQAIGVALEARRLDVVEQAITQGGASDSLLAYVFDAAMTIVQHIDFRNTVLRLLLRLYNNLPEPDYLSMSQCYLHLNDAAACAAMLTQLVGKSRANHTDDDHLLLAYQVAFDLEENARQDFLQRVSDHLQPSSADTEMADGNAAKDAAKAKKDPISEICTILSGKHSIKLNSEFLYRNNQADLLILKGTKEALDSRNSVFHAALSFANAFMHAGTASDKFLRENLEWLSRASNWTKFSATAALGVIHKGQVENGRAIVEPYLPQEGVSSGSQFSEGGSLFALGLIHANYAGASVLQFLTGHLKSTQSEVIQHGACLGIGVAGMASANEEVYEVLKTILFSDSAVAGEAAGLAMGLVMLGTASQRHIDEMLQYAHDTQHEKIIRGLAIGVAMIMYGREDEADALIETLKVDKDPILRYGCIYMAGMAYAGTGNNKTIRLLLHVAVSDTSDDVRRAAVTCLGFLLFHTPTQVPRLVQLLAESYNPHVRYGATLALGMSCAGTGLTEALDLLEPMTKDPVDYVRQGALIASAMILVQHNEAQSPKVAAIRKQYETIIADRHEDVTARFGSVLGQGILDAGGRNVTISMQSRNGHTNMSAVVGMTLFTQFWYWYPLTHFLSLAFTPTGLIGLNAELGMPQFDFVSNARPSLFAYPPPKKVVSETKIEKIAAAILSTTAKAKARSTKKKDGKDATAGKDGAKDAMDDTAATTTTDAGKEPAKAKKVREPTSQTLSNMQRVLPTQWPHITFPEGARFVPIKKQMLAGGITLMRDTRPADGPAEMLTYRLPAVAAAGTAGAASGAGASADSFAGEPEPPAPFEYTEEA
ncbi:hypothetical protein CXG81DRAFT_15699 [Caulochytrium protostelioides]|uniref:26S proteasome regulatory subunit RPN2 n=1 Tax=Caulochytrium protostelioides TaxID=1555241 RepID=A0A4P9X0X5_9FUNG|nr:hypothetical protein CXG81DRAFT_15699 [Caulochytrium protostelioides]|eukprot:RKO98605.1 hypothetical protein CXG81DRAFT_15699 [Caulochytrium protostelioides]